MDIELSIHRYCIFVQLLDLLRIDSEKLNMHLNFDKYCQVVLQHSFHFLFILVITWKYHNKMK